jgi:transposase
MTNDARFIAANRTQTRWDFVDLEALLPSDHRARIVMSFVESLDLSPLYDKIKSREGEAGRPPPDPAVLLALWLYATIEGVGSARQLDRLAERDLPYQWIAGGVPLNYHGLADFRVEHVQFLDQLLTETVTSLIAEGVVSLAEVAIDGTKVRANAGRESFKTGSKLAQIEAAVEQRVTKLKAELESDPAASSRRKLGAQLRAAEEVKERAERARRTVDQVRAEREERAKRHVKDEKNKSEAKASLTDPEARNMKFPDGSVAPAYNAQIAAQPKEGIIVSVEMTDRRNDSGLAAPMVDNIVARYGEAPETVLVDTHYATNDDIVALAEHAAGPVKVFAPPPAERDDISARGLANRKRKREREPNSVKEWRGRMATEAGQKMYSLRKLIERVNANFKNHGFRFLRVRGLIKAKAVALWHALAHNLMAVHRLRARALASA